MHCDGQKRRRVQGRSGGEETVRSVWSVAFKMYIIVHVLVIFPTLSFSAFSIRINFVVVYIVEFNLWPQKVLKIKNEWMLAN